MKAVNWKPLLWKTGFLALSEQNAAYGWALGSQ